MANRNEEMLAEHDNDVDGDDEEMVVLGGQVGAAAGENSSMISRYESDRQCLSWSRVYSKGIVPPPRSGAASVVVKGRLYVYTIDLSVYSPLDWSQF